MNQPANKLRRLFLASVVLGATGLLNGCLTRALYKHTAKGQEVSSVLISADGKHLVFIDKNYHYIFDAPSVIIKTLGSGFQEDIEASFSTFHVDTDQRITGRVSLRGGHLMRLLSEEKSEKYKKQALQAGYSLTKDGSYEAVVELKGTRYKSNGIQPDLPSQDLNQKYWVFVDLEESSLKKAGKILVTPITLAVDGVLLIGSVPLTILAAPFGAAFFVFAASRPH